MIDLVCLVADQNMKAVVETLLTKHQALGIRQIEAEVIPHPQHDPGCYGSPTGLLSVYAKQARQGLVLMDREWDGVPDGTATELEANIDKRLGNFPAGWAKSVVIDPELEVWLFTRSPRLDEALGWHGRHPSLAEETAATGQWAHGAPKPRMPKVTMKWALSRVGKQTSSSIYRQIASHLGVAKCTDPAFNRFRQVLQSWFPVP